MSHFTKALLSSSVVAALLLVGLPGMALAETSTQESKVVARQLGDFKRAAFQMNREAETLRSQTELRKMSWETHAYRLGLLRGHVNELGKSLAALEEQKPAASDMQALAIEQSRPHLVLVAERLTEAIGLINEDRSSVHWGDLATWSAISRTTPNSYARSSTQSSSMTTRGHVSISWNCKRV